MNIKSFITAIFMAILFVGTANASRSTDYRLDEFKAIEDKYENVIDEIIDTAQVMNVNPILPAAVAYRETRFDHTLKNRVSSATGLFQITNGTAQGLIKLYGEDLEVKPGTSMYNKTANIKLGIAYMTLIENQMSKSLGRNVTNGEIYLGLKYGPAGAANMLRNPNQLMMNGFSGARKGNEADFHDRRGNAMTKGQAARQVINQYNEAARFYAPIVAQRVSIKMEARMAAIRKQQQEERLEAIRTMHNTIRSEPAYQFANTTVDVWLENQGVHVTYDKNTTPSYNEHALIVTSGRKYKGDII